MKKLNYLLWMLFLPVVVDSNAQSFLESQLKYPRVRQANKNYASTIDKMLLDKNIDKASLQLKLRAFKTEQKFEVWAKSKLQTKYVLLKTYDICASSGSLGPKLKQGDGQVPEGIYTIDRFNPTSLYHLSLGISYPNSTDKVRSNGLNPGGDIFIHGRCVTIGCLPMTDAIIEQIYLLAIHAKQANKAAIEVEIYPFRLTDKNLQAAKNTETGKKWMPFWVVLALKYEQID
jgi:murein L,D-transpeptidase YafK